MANGLAPQGVLQVVPPAALEAHFQQQQLAAAQAQAPPTPAPPELIAYIRGQFEIFRNHRNTVSGWSNRMLEALRTYNGQYNPTKLQEVMRFGGSQIYARISAQKCRAATSLLRDIYLGADRPWGIEPPADPEVPLDIQQKIHDLMLHEQQMVTQTLGQSPGGEDIEKRRRGLLEAARLVAKKKAADQAQVSEDKVEEILREGGFYHALAEFLVDISIFPFACIKGPVVKILPEVVWPPAGGRPTVQQRPVLTWQRISPFDLWWTPGVGDIANAAIIEKSRLTRAELNDLLDLPGFDQTAVRAVLEEYGRGGLYDNWDTTDAERAVLESRENPAWNRSNLITQMEYHGNVQGQVLQEYGMAAPDPLRDYHIQAFCIGSHIIKAQMSPSPRARHPYYLTSFEKVPGTPIGNGLVDIIADLQEAANATLRSLVNNMAMASGPQTVVNDDRVRSEDDADQLYPWKRWHVTNDPVGNNAKPPVEFYQPDSRAQELILVFKAFVDLADDVSAIPRYIGGQTPGGAGRTASGLSMLMSSAAKILQTVAANIDRDIFEQALEQLTDLIMLTDTSGLLTGQENISVQGVSVAVQRETQRQRQLEFLQITNNPTDMQIVGLKGRGAVLRSVGQNIGITDEDIVPDDDVLEQRQQAAQQQGPQQAIAQKIDQGVAQGVQQGVQRITSELTSGILAQQQAMPEGMPTHLGTLPGTGPLAQAAAQAQGNQPTPFNQQNAQPTTLTGNQPKPPGPGARPPMPGGGPG